MGLGSDFTLSLLQGKNWCQLNLLFIYQLSVEIKSSIWRKEVLNPTNLIDSHSLYIGGFSRLQILCNRQTTQNPLFIDLYQ